MLIFGQNISLDDDDGGLQGRALSHDELLSARR